MIYSNRLLTLHLLKIAARLAFAGIDGLRGSAFYFCVYEYNKVFHCNYTLKSCTMWLYWQKYLQGFYSDNAVRRKAA